jgi:hypothetical protein
MRALSLVVLAASLALPACQPEPDPNHGYGKVQFKRAENLDASPFGGTTFVNVNITYDECLADFYAANPDWAADGIDGAPVFEKFADPDSGKYLCSQSDNDDPAADCDVVEITQDLDNSRITFDYKINEASIENKVVYIGPLPCEKLTMCLPTVRVTGNAVRGTGPNDEAVWATSSIPQPSTSCGQGLPIQIRASPN